MSLDRRVLCILPAYNERGKIGLVVEKVKATGEVQGIVVIDDGSTDGTAGEAEAAGATVVRHEINRGVGAAIRTGLDFGRRNGFDIGVILSGDDQHEPTELPRILDPLRRGGALFVQGSRRLPGGRSVNGPLFREVTTRFYSLVFSILAGHRITDATNGFRAFFLSILDDRSLDLDQPWLDTYELEPYLLYRAARSRDIRVMEVPITIYYRGGVRQYSKMKPFRDWWRIFRPLLFLRLGLRR